MTTVLVNENALNDLKERGSVAATFQGGGFHADQMILLNEEQMKRLIPITPICEKPPREPNIDDLTTDEIFEKIKAFQGESILD